MKNFQRVQEIWSEQERDGWPSIVSLTLSLHRLVIGSTHHLTKANIWPKFNKAVWMATERPQNSQAQTDDLQLWPWPCQHSWIIGSAHHLTEINIWSTFKENPSRDKGDMEPTPNSRLKSVTFNCDIDLKSAGLNYGFYTLSHWGEHLTKVRENPPRGKGDTERTQNSKLKLGTLNCDLVSLHSWAMGSTHHFTEANIWPN